VTVSGGSGEEIDEFCCAILRDIAARSNGTISVNTIRPNTKTDEDGEEMVTVSFKHDSKRYKWSFEADYAEEFNLSIKTV